MSPIRELIREIHRRSLWQVLLIYVVGAWIAFEVVQTLTEGLGLPTWFPALAFVLLLVGLPIVIATAFVQEGPPTSSRDDPTLFPGSGPAARSEPAPAQDRADRPSFARWLNWRNAILGGLAAFALWGIVAAAWLLLDLGASGQAASGPGEGTLSTGSAVADESSAPAGEGAAVLSLETDPPEVEVTLVPVRPGPVSDTGAARDLGRTPLSGRRVPVGEYLVRLSMERVNPLEFLVELEPGDSIHLRRSLVSTSLLTEGMVLVSDGPVPAAAGGGAVPRAYLIDRHEVTNAEFLEFVSADGYQDPSFWPETMQVEDRRLPRAEALGHFVDRTGRPGPRYWSGGLYPEGEGERPVVGVSWYEAQAYARWSEQRAARRSRRGQRLPPASVVWVVVG